MNVSNKGEGIFYMKKLMGYALVVAVCAVGLGGQAGAVSGADIDDNTITSVDILNGSIAGIDILDGSINSADIKDDSILSRDIRNDSLISADIKNNSLKSIDIQDGAVKLVDLHVEVHNTFDSIVSGADSTATMVAALQSDVTDLQVWSETVNAALVSVEARVDALEMRDDRIWVLNGHDDVLGILLDEENYGDLTAVKYFDTASSMVHEMPKYGDDVQEDVVSFMLADCEGQALAMNPDTRVYPYDTESFFVRSGDHYWIYDLNDTTVAAGSSQSYVMADGTCVNAALAGEYRTLKDVSEGFVDGSAYPLRYQYGGAAI